MPHRFLPYKRTDFLALVLLIAIVWSVFFGLLIYRAYAVSSTDEKLCRAIRGIVQGAGRPGIPGSAGFSYYRQHPDELRVARASYDRTLRSLNCMHLPSGTTKVPTGEKP
jgi:hypothetical protein